MPEKKEYPYCVSLLKSEDMGRIQDKIKMANGNKFSDLNVSDVEKP